MPTENEIFDLRQQLFREYDTGEFSVSELCRRYGLSRTWFYKLRTRRERQGAPGLRISSRGRPGSLNQLNADVESLVLSYVRQNPSHGPGRIAANLSQHELGGQHLGHTAVYGILKKHGLTTRNRRINWQRKQT